jgi:phosphoribosylglycinamide formyltransferase-1
MRAMRNIVILISGRGSNMRAIVRAAQSERWPANIAAVISNRADAEGLAFAREHGIACAVVANADFPTRADFDAALQATIDGFNPDLLVLAGFMRILTAQFVEHYAGRMLNIHPSLLPNFPGLATHRQALEAGVSTHGATVHLVTAELDHGPIVAQVTVPVLPGDTEQTLAERVLEQEHILYPRAVRCFIEGKVTNN